jgi:hypothetical protein
MVALGGGAVSIREVPLYKVAMLDSFGVNDTFLSLTRSGFAMGRYIDHVGCVLAPGKKRSGRGTTRAEDASGTPTQGHISPSILVYKEHSGDWHK